MKKILQVVFLLFCSSALMAQNATLTNVVIGPANITVTYDLTTTNPVDVILCYSLDGKCSWDDAGAVFGDITCQTTGNGKTIVWDNIADSKKYGIFYFKLKTTPRLVCDCMFAPEATVPAGQYVDVVVKGVVTGGVFVGSTAPTTIKTFRYLTYNLGADPTLTPKQQMASIPMQPEDPKVYGGFYQWGRKDPRHTFRCDPTPDADGDTKFTISVIPTASLPSSDNGKFVWGTVVLVANFYNWAYPNVNASPFWGNGGGLGTQTNTTYTGEQNSQNPCPPGYRVPTQHEWALLGQEAGNATTISSDSFSTPTNVTLSRSNLYWVNVVNGRVSSAFTDVGNALCGYAIYKKEVWEAAAPGYANGTLDLFSASAPEPLLFLPAAGSRGYTIGAFSGVGTGGNYWSSTVNSNRSYYLSFGSSGVNVSGDNNRAFGYSVRCVAELFSQPDPVGATICPGTTHTFTLGVATGEAGTLTYLWQQSADNVTWVPAAGANTGANYTTPALSTNMYYRRQATCSKGTITTAAALITADAICMSNSFPTTTHIPTSAQTVAVPITVRTAKDAAGNWIHDNPVTGVTTTTTLNFLTYNLGADPTITPKEQMKQKYACANDIRVYGGCYQWGRKDAEHSLRCDVADAPAYFLNDNGALRPSVLTYNPATDTKFVWHSNLAPNYWWAQNEVNNSNLWGNGCTVGSGCPTPGAAAGSDACSMPSGCVGGNKNVSKRPNDPCPSGYRVPTQHEWALLGWEGGNSTTTIGDEVSSITNDITVSKSGLVWVRVRNGLINGSWAANNMCGYAIYSKAVWDAVYPSTPPAGTDLTVATAPNPLLFLSAAGSRSCHDGLLTNVGGGGSYWGSTVGINFSYGLLFNSNSVTASVISLRAAGYSVRCIAE